MSKELVIVDFQTQLAELDKIQETCKKLLQTKHYMALGEVGIHAIMARSKALGIHPFEALNGGFHCINGKVGMSTEMMAALVRRRGHSIQKDPKSNGECVILHGKRSDNGDTWTCSFSKADAEAAGLWNSATWKKYPEIMLYNRCMSKLFRQLFPDLSLGAGYVEDELKEITKTGDYKNVINIDAHPMNDDVKPLYIEQAEVEFSINGQQVIELGDVIYDCEKGYLEKILGHFKIATLNDLPASKYDAVKKKAEAARELHNLSKKLKEEKSEAVA